MRWLRPEEILGLLFGVMVALLLIVFRDQVGVSKEVLHLVSSYSVIYLTLWGLLAFFMRIAYGVTNISSILRDWLPFYGCILVYEFLHRFINDINPNEYHEILIKIDYFIFGGLASEIYSSRFNELSCRRLSHLLPLSAGLGNHVVL